MCKGEACKGYAEIVMLVMCLLGYIEELPRRFFALPALNYYGAL